MKRWYVVHAYSGFEKSVAQALRDAPLCRVSPPFMRPVSSSYPMQPTLLLLIAVTPENMKIAVRVVVERCSQREESLAPMLYPIEVRQSVQQLVQNAIAADAALPMVSD